MKILALEFSSERRSAAVLDNARPGEGESLSRPRAAASASEEGAGRDLKALSLIQKALEKGGMERGEIDCIAVGVGPGSYAGVRVAISIAQAWQLASDIRLLGINAADCLAAQAAMAGLQGEIAIAIDAQRGEFYLACYEIRDQESRLRAPVHLAGKDEVGRLAGAGRTILGPNLSQEFPSARDFFPEAAMLAMLAAARTDFVAGEHLEPVYLRPTTFVKAPPAQRGSGAYS